MLLALTALVPVSFGSSLGAASAFLENGQPEAALNEVDAYLEDVPGNVAARFLRARALEDMGDTRDAIKIYQDLVDESPALPEALINLSVYYAKHGSLDIARNLLLRAIHAQQSCSLAYQNLSQLHAGIASQTYQKALSAEGESIDTNIEPLVRVSLLSSMPPMQLPAKDTESFAVALAKVSAENQEPAQPEITADAAAVEEQESVRPDIAADTAGVEEQQPVQAEIVAADTAVAGDQQPTQPEVAVVDKGEYDAVNQVDSGTTVETGGEIAPDIEVTAVDAGTDAPIDPTEPSFVGRSERMAVAKRETESSGETIATGQIDTPDPAIDMKTAEEAVRNMLTSWRTAWVAGDVDSYLEHYSTDFTPATGSRQSWEKQRRRRLKSPKSIKIDISDIEIIVTRDKAVASFRQNYESDTYQDEVQKTLMLQAVEKGKWEIFREVSG